MIYSLLLDDRSRVDQADAEGNPVAAARISRSKARESVDEELRRPADPIAAAEYDEAKQREEWGAGETGDMDVWGPEYGA